MKMAWWDKNRFSGWAIEMLQMQNEISCAKNQKACELWRKNGKRNEAPLLQEDLSSFDRRNEEQDHWQR